MEIQEKNKIFSDIDNLYAKYLEISLKKNEADFKGKYDVALKTAKDKLIIAVCKLYFKFENKVDSNKNIPLVTSMNKNNDNYSDIVVREIINAMDTYTENGYTFSQYVCMKINQERGKEESKKIASSNNGGCLISEYEAQQIRRVMKKDKDLKKFGIYDEDKRNEKLAELFSTGTHTMTVKSVIHFKQLGSCNTTAMEYKNSDGENCFVIDNEENRTEKHFIKPESELLKKEFEVQIDKFFSEIDKIYLEKHDKRVSEILTISVLKSFQVQKNEYIEVFNSLKNFYHDTYLLLLKFEFIDKTILKAFFEEPSYVLPTQHEIEEKYDLNDKYAAKLLQRFRETLYENKNIEKNFYDYFKEK